jgi:hypothetical protein
MVEMSTVPNQRNRLIAARTSHSSVVLVTLRLHIARPFHTTKSAYPSVRVAISIATMHNARFRL